jgi:hypothetical protein
MRPRQFTGRQTLKSRQKKVCLNKPTAAEQNHARLLGCLLAGRLLVA